MANLDESIKLLHYKDSLMFSRPINCSGIQMSYIGKFIGESQLSDDWYVGTGLNKILCISFAGGGDVSELFTFQGDFTITKITIISTDLTEISCLYEKLDIDNFDKSKESFENGGSYFRDYNSTHLEIDTIEETDVYKNNLLTKQNEFYYESGENYFGEYHQHSSGQAMTESSHNVESVKIYRKDEKNKLYKPKSKKLKSIILDPDSLIQRDDKRKYKIKSGEDTVTTLGTTTTKGGAGGSGGY